MAKVAFEENSPDEICAGFGIEILIPFKEVANREQAQFLKLEARVEP